MIEYGIFNAEGCVERGFASEAEARNAIAAEYAYDDDAVPMVMCPDHADEEQPGYGCETCDGESGD